MEEENKKKSSKVLLIVISIITVIVIGIVIFIVAGGDELFTKNNEKEDTSSSKVIDEEDEKDSKSSKNKDDEEDEEDSKSSKNKDDEEDEEDSKSSKNKDDEEDEEDSKSNTNKDDSKNSSKSNSSKITSKEFAIDGVSYKLGVNYSELEKNGWEINLEGESNDKIKAKTKDYNSWELRNSKYDKDFVTVYFRNNSDKEANVKECQICEIRISNYTNDLQFKFELPGGIKFGSTQEEVKKAYGEPTVGDDEGMSYYLDDINLYLGFDKDGKINYINYYLN